MKIEILIPVAVLLVLSGCIPLAGAAVGAAATDYFVDDNDECNGPSDAGLLDSDCQDD